jgi:lipoyl(octanoyl) transferase
VSTDAPLLVRDLGRQPYGEIWQAMRAYTDARDAGSPDELWLLEHPPVYTQGLAGRPEHVLAPGGIPVIETDRGGQVTYHGPGQMVAYPLLDLDRLGIGIRSLVCTLEAVIIDLLAEIDIPAHRTDGAPGVFVDGAKIASIGMKVRRGCTFHGIAFNLDLDLEPFSRINPCGFAGQPMTRLVDLRSDADLRRVPRRFAELLAAALGLDWTFAASHDAGHPLASRAGLTQSA